MVKRTNLSWLCVLVLGLGGTTSADEYIDAPGWSGVLDIPDGGQETMSVEVSGAPANAYVTEVEYALIVDDRGNEANFWCSDYEIYIGNDTRGIWHHGVWNNEGGKTDEGADYDQPDDSDIVLLPPYSSVHRFDGDPVNQKWYVGVEDNDSTHFPAAYHGLGRLTRFEVKIWYRLVRPDLYDMDSSGFWSSSVGGGQEFHVAYRVGNGGDVASGPFTVSHYLSTDTTITTGDYHLGDKTVSGVSEGGSVIFQMDWSFPPDFPAPGTYYVGWILDSDNSIDEHNEDNNTAYVEAVLVAVPQLAGMTESEAEAALTAAGLVVGTKQWGPSDEPPGTVIGQEPPAGQIVAGGSTVDPTLSQYDDDDGGGEPAPKLVAHWRLDETEGTIAFDSAGENDGIVYGYPAWVAGLIDGALQLDGMNDYVDCGNDPSLDITEAITLAAWINPRDIGNGEDNPYVTKGDRSYAIKGFREGNTIEFFVYEDYHHTARFTGAGAFNNEWHHVAGTYDGSQLKLYIDGALGAATAYAGSIASTTYSVNIGRNAEHPYRFYQGLIDDVRLYDQALSESQIQTVMAPPIPGLVAHWKLDETSGGIAHDSRGEYDGTLQGNPLWLPDAGMSAGALAFDGLDDYVEIADHADLEFAGQMTVAAWIQVGVFDKAWQAIVTKGDSAWRIQRDNMNDVIEFACTGLSVPGTWGQVLGNVHVNDGQWHHVAGVYDGSRISLYVDGVLDASSVASGRIAANHYAVMIGENAEARDRYWNGQIDDVRIYERPLSESEIQAVMAGVVSQPTPDGPETAPLVAHWALDETSGRIAAESVGGIDGVTMGGPLWQPSGGKVGGALDFDGSNDLVVTDFVLDPADGPFSVFAWIKGGAPGEVIISQDGSAGGADWLTAEPTTGRLMTDLKAPGPGGRSLSSAKVVTDGNWHEVGLTWDGSSRTLYVDGVAVATDSLTGLIGSTGGLNIGVGKNLDPGSYWSGLIDDVRIGRSGSGPPQGPGTDLTFVSISEPGFTGQMSRYETTNAQYCAFLNAALASGDITVSGDLVVGASGSNAGADYVGELYYEGGDVGHTGLGATNGGASRIHYTQSGGFRVYSGFEDHPVTQVSWYGATAFCNYYGYRLPTEDEWQAVADYDGSYSYGCGTSISNSMANYYGSIHPDGTAPVGSFGSYGYGMCEMAGNLFEWTSTGSGSSRILRGGGWHSGGIFCSVSYSQSDDPDKTTNCDGFRVCRD